MTQLLRRSRDNSSAKRDSTVALRKILIPSRQIKLSGSIDITNMTAKHVGGGLTKTTGLMRTSWENVYVITEHLAFQIPSTVAMLVMILDCSGNNITWLGFNVSINSSTKGLINTRSIHPLN